MLSIYLAVYIASKTATVYIASKTAVEVNKNNPLPLKKPNIPHPQSQNKDEMKIKTKLESKRQANKDQEKNNYLHQFTKTLFEIIKENTHSRNINNKSQKIISQLWKEAIMSLYMDDSYDNEMIQDLFTNLLEMIHISEGNSGDMDQTNPAHDESNHPATSAENIQKILKPILQQLQ